MQQTASDIKPQPGVNKTSAVTVQRNTLAAGLIAAQKPLVNHGNRAKRLRKL